MAPRIPTLYHCTIGDVRTIALADYDSTTWLVQHPAQPERWAACPSHAIVLGGMVQASADLRNPDAIGVWDWHQSDGWTYRPAMAA